MNEGIAVGISSRAAFYLFVVAGIDFIFPQFCEGRSLFACDVFISFSPNKYFIYMSAK